MFYQYTFCKEVWGRSCQMLYYSTGVKLKARGPDPARRHIKQMKHVNFPDACSNLDQNVTFSYEIEKRDFVCIFL